MRLRGAHEVVIFVPQLEVALLQQLGSLTMTVITACVRRYVLLPLCVCVGAW